ncbi:MAG TPA: MMPL family transporter [Ilumatobacteraceae bacterium]|nr:MMPL family transporter [Ilumatobacteraceae bacterium]
MAALHAHLGRTLAVVAAISALLVLPFLAMAPDESASTEPVGDVFTARDRVDDTFASTVRGIGLVIEDRGGDLLRAEPLNQLFDAQQLLREDPELGPTLFSYFEVDATRDVTGILSLADLVDDELRATEGIALAAATDAQVKAAGAALIERFGLQSDLLNLSTQTTQGPDGDWIVPAIAPAVLADDTVLGFGATSVNLGGDTAPEEYDREIQDVLRTADDLQVNGIAIDVNLTSQEQGAIAGPFIGFTILAVLVMVGATFRSYWVLATVSTSFILLIVWLKGISNLIGLKDDLVLSLIVPIAMISFGIDFAFHAIGRYREERAAGASAAPAIVTGLAAVSAALLLALVSGSVAFLANVTSGIESITQFGIGAAIALASAYLLLGVVTPLVVARIEADVPPPTPGRRATALRIAAAVAASAMTMGSVLLMVFLLPWLGTIVAVLTILAIAVVPYLRQRRRRGTGPAVGDLPVVDGGHRLARPVGRAISAVARYRLVVVPVALAVTAAAFLLAVQVPAEFDVEDFFASDTDFVVGLDQLDAHVGDRGGEPALIYVEGDLADPSNLAALQGRLDEVRALDTPSLARTESGDVAIDGGVFEVFEAAWQSPAMADLVALQTGVELTDVDADALPDTRAQVEALIAVASDFGVPFDRDRSILTPDDVRTAVSLDGPTAATVFELGLVDSRAQESVAAAKDGLQPIAETIAADLGGTFVQVTGSPFVREGSLDGTNRALQVSLPVAVLLCLAVATIFLRSIRYGLASIVPILMVVTWLYAFMELAGYAINLVTATIAAVSIGIGISFAIHFIARYRTELERTGDRVTAVSNTGEGTGVALVASAASSAVGFAILALAPMPLFAAYGLLTALMILMALIATLVVLPGVLMLITRDRSVTDDPSASPPADQTPRASMAV